MVSGDNVVPLGLAQYARTVAVDVTRPAGCTADYRVALPSLFGLSAVNGTTIDLSSPRLENEDAGVAQSGTIRFTDGAVSVTLPLQVTPQRWVKISTADATPEPIDGGESVTVRARSTIVSWNSQAYGSFGNRQHRLQVRNVTAGDSYPGLGSGTIVRSSATGALVKTRTLGSPEAEANTIYGCGTPTPGIRGRGSPQQQVPVTRAGCWCAARTEP